MVRSGIVGRAAVAALIVASCGACQRMAVVSVSPDGQVQAGSSPTVSHDGRYVAFVSAAALTADDHNGVADVFRRDLRTGVTVRVSLDLGGGDPNSGSGGPLISADGRYVAFSSNASDLTTGDTNGQRDAFRRDLVANQTVRVSIDSTGNDIAGNAGATSISADGNEVAFNEVTRVDVFSTSDVFVRDVAGATTDAVGLGDDGDDGAATLSADGSVVAFCHIAGEFPSIRDNIYVRDLGSGSLTMMVVDPHGNPAGGVYCNSSVSGDGRYVAFASDADGIVEGDANGYPDVFIRDRQLGTTRRVTVDVGGGDPDWQSYGPSISDDGRLVAFVSDATDLVADDTNDSTDIFVRDIVAGTTTRASVDPFGHETLRSGEDPDISADGSVVTFVAAVPVPSGGISTPVVYLRSVPDPGISGVSPSTIARGTSATLTITGHGFPADAVVTMPRPGVTIDAVTVIDDHTIEAHLTVAPGAPSGTADVCVGDPAPGVGLYGATAGVVTLPAAVTIV